MGVLVERGTARRFTLGPRCVIGRHPGCDLRVDDPHASGEHAGLRWIGEAWELRDLGSRNGTFVEGRRLGTGERVALGAGATFTVGSLDGGFSLEDASPPIACARSAKTGLSRAAADGILVLPDDARLLVSVFEDARGKWVAELEDETRAVADHDILIVDGEAWTLALPEPIGATWEGCAGGPTIETIALRLGVSRDEEHVEVAVMHDGKETVLPPRSHQYLLVVLARARLHDQHASPAERGWVDRPSLCKMLATDANKLNVDIFRLRKQLGALGVHGAVDLVARRPGTGQLRIGTDRVEVVRL